MKGLVRVWKELDIHDVERYLIVVGELSAECFSCHKIGIDAKTQVCLGCGAGFKYMGFRRKLEISYLRKMSEEFPHLVFIDFEDFKKAIGKGEARRILNI